MGQFLGGVRFRRPDTERGFLNPIERIVQVRCVPRFRRPDNEWGLLNRAGHLCPWTNHGFTRVLS
jgi:hypothetical protein